MSTNVDDILDSPAIAPGRSLQYAGFWIRVAATLLDSLILIFGTGIINYALQITPRYGDSPDQFSDPGRLSLFLAVLGIESLLFIAYPVIMESSSWQCTLGKKAVGIMVGNLDGSRITFANALGRYFAKFLSALILYIGFIMVGFDDKKQGLHDKLAGTVVFYGSK